MAKPTKSPLQYHLARAWWDLVYTATLLGGEFANCHGRGRTAAEAVTCLKLIVAFRRRLRKHSQTKG